MTLNGTVLSATCKRADETTDSHSTLDLNQYLANNEGHLVPARGGNFGASCNNIQLVNGKILTCTASKNDGSQVNAQIDLSTFIANIDGQLQAS